MAEVLTRAAILEADDLQIERVPVPEWGGEVLIRGLTGRERDQFEVSIQMPGSKARPKVDNIRARLVALAVVDEEGKRVFSDRDVQALGRKSAAVLDRLFDVARRLSGLTEGDVEELAADFDGAQSGGSGSI
jgi:hypothetical protein